MQSIDAILGAVKRGQLCLRAATHQGLTIFLREREAHPDERLEIRIDDPAVRRPGLDARDSVQMPDVVAHGAVEARDGGRTAREQRRREVRLHDPSTSHTREQFGVLDGVLVRRPVL